MTADRPDTIGRIDSPAVFNEALGARVRAARKHKGMTQEALAVAVGLRRTSIVNIEGGKSGTTIQHLVFIADHLGVQVESLIPGSDSRPPAVTRVDLDRLVRSLEAARDRLDLVLADARMAFDPEDGEA